jgi:hypothetical protein
MREVTGSLGVAHRCRVVVAEEFYDADVETRYDVHDDSGFFSSSSVHGGPKYGVRRCDDSGRDGERWARVLRERIVNPWKSFLSTKSPPTVAVR